MTQPTTSSYSLLFIDDHPIYCDGLAFALRHWMPNLKLVTVVNGAQALAVLQGCDVDLVLSDYRLPDDDGISVLSRIAARHPSVALGVLCSDVTPLLAQKAQRIGAVACLSKERDMASMAEVLGRLFSGETVFDAVPLCATRNGISEHRLTIIRLAADGQSNKEIARVLGISERTVKDHWSIVFERLGVVNRIQAIRQAQKQGLIEST